jgi:hypothetical protein
MLSRFFTVAVLLTAISVLVGGSAGCTSSSSDGGPSSSGDDTGGLPPFNSIDTSVSCPAGQIGWNFSTGGTSLDDVEGTPDDGIQVVTASYGLNCSTALVNDVLPTVRQQCDGLTNCGYTVGGPNPAVTCVKQFDTTYRCGIDPTIYSGHIGGNSFGQTFTYQCARPLKIQSAFWGVNCGTALGDATSLMQAACDGTRATCSFVVPKVNNIDPAGGCAKDFEVRYQCGDEQKVYLSTTPGEALGKTVKIGCSSLPEIDVTDATWGTNCPGVQDGNETVGLSQQCDGLTTCVPKLTIADPSGGCAKDLVVSYSCGSGQSFTVQWPGEAQTNKTLKLDCTGVTPYAAAPPAVSTGVKGCIPHYCPYNSTRDPNTLQCTPAAKGLLKQVRLDSWDLTQNHGLETYPADSVPRPPGVLSALGFDKSYTTIIGLHLNAPTNITANLTLSGDAVKGNLAPYFTQRFTNPSTGQTVDGFLCALSPMGLDFPGASTPTAVHLTQSAPLPAQCFDARSNAAADAAARLGMTQPAFAKAYVNGYVRLHFALDPEGNFGVVPNAVLSAAGVPYAPNPPGFFYTPATNFTSLVDFYAQRELASFYATPDGAILLQEPTPVSLAGVYSMVSSYGDMDIAITGAQLRRGSALDVNYFDTDTSGAVVAVDVDWQLIMDNPLNPLSPTSIVPSSAIKTLNQRNMRATVELVPGAGTQGIAIGSIPLTNGVPTGSSVSGSFVLPSAVRSALFGAWAGYSSFGIKVCLDIDGSNTRSGGTVKVTGNSVFGANVTTNCLQYPGLINVTREIVSRPIPPLQMTAQTGATNNSANGDGNNSSANNSGVDKKCTRQTGAAGATETCTQDTSATSLGGGQALNATFYSSGATATTTVSPDGTTNARIVTDGEFYGYQILDPNDPVDSPDMNITNTQTFTVAPNWEALVEAFNATEEESGEAEEPVEEKARVAKFGEHQGFGLALGVRIKLGEFGELEIAVGVGVSIAFTFQVSNVPPAPYSCLNTTGTKCYQVLTNAATQPASQTACKVLGGELAEGATAAESTAILEAANGNSAYWIGGQVDYQYPDLACAQYPQGYGCADQVRYQYRWLSSDREFALSEPLPIPNYPFAAPLYFGYGNIDPSFEPLFKQEFNPPYPAPGGLAVFGQQQVLTLPQSTSLPAVCELQPAVSARYLSTSFSVPIGAGAGLSLSWCWPSAEIGLCLQGSLNFVTIQMTPTMTSTSTSLLDGSKNVIGTRGDTNVSIPWDLDLLGGEIDAIANFFFFTLNYPLWSYPPFVAASGTLANYDWPSQEDCQGPCQ